ncbi:sialin-like [Nilaparvata lugens]|uniref:sialin-like n=1 Tax=Nilaparvata lugens TaxID=108931 RepID=UPI00193EA150|nr:sialin-like [Nilaparvata lugens]
MGCVGNLKKRKIFIIMVFFGFALNFLFRHVVHMALLVYTFENDQASKALNERAKLQFFYGYSALQIPCARLAEIFGGKTISGVGILFASLLSVIMPFAVQIGGFESLIFINFFIGISLAGFIPAIFNMASKWIPAEERGNLVIAFAATQLGQSSLAVSMQFRNTLSTEVVFIIPAILGIFWTLCWYILVSDSPLTHPTITREERNYIVRKKESQGTIYNVIDCPWFEILFDSHVWVICSVHTCYWFSAIFLTTKEENFLKERFNLSPLENPLPIISPYFLASITIFLSGILIDFLYSINVPLTYLQKSWTLISTFIPAIALVGLISCQDNVQLTLFFYVLGVTFSYWVIGGYYLSFLDIAPNFAATLNGIAATIANIGLIMIQEVMHGLDSGGVDNQQIWENRHSFVSALLFTAGILYTLFGNSHFVDWNIPYKYEDV